MTANPLLSGSSCPAPLVIAGLDPAIHRFARPKLSSVAVDARVKPGHDDFKHLVLREAIV